MANRLSVALSSLAKKLRSASADYKDEERQDFTSASDRLAALAIDCEDWRTQQHADAVYWIDVGRVRRGRPRITLAAAPLDVGPSLRQQLFEKTPTVIMTSATLAVAGRSFDYFKSRVGLTAARAEQWGSPFNYQEQAELVTLTDMPDPTAEPVRYERQCVAMIERYAGRTDGHAFVLLTSYDMMRRIAEGLLPWLRAHNLALYNQAEGLPRSTMLERFKANPRGVLLGTDSFWQGVDVPGDALQTVIIARLPFRRARSSAVGCALGSDQGSRRQSVSGIPTAGGGAKAQAGLWTPDSHGARSRQRDRARPARAHQALWPHVSGELAAVSAGGRIGQDCRARRGLTFCADPVPALNAPAFPAHLSPEPSHRERRAA